MDEKQKEPMCCPICAGLDMQYWYSKFGYDLMKCSFCSHVSVQPLPSADEIRAGYTANTETPFVPIVNYYHHLKESEKGHSGRAASLALGMVERYSGGPPGRWLDIGAGSGYLVEEARRAGWDAQGIEPGPWGVIAAQDKKIPITQAFWLSGSSQGIPHI